MNNVLLIVTGAALLAQGYIDNRKQAELKAKIDELQKQIDDPTDQQCASMFNVCVNKYLKL